MKEQLDISSITNVFYYVTGMGIITWMFNSFLKKVDKVEELEKRIAKLEWVEEHLNKPQREK